MSDTLLPGKATKLQLLTTVPQTDTGARDEYSKALERTLEKELGKLLKNNSRSFDRDWQTSEELAFR